MDAVQVATVPPTADAWSMAGALARPFGTNALRELDPVPRAAAAICGDRGTGHVSATTPTRAAGEAVTTDDGYRQLTHRVPRQKRRLRHGAPRALVTLFPLSTELGQKLCGRQPRLTREGRSVT